MNANPQMDLFGAPEEKSFAGANGVKLPYWERDGKIIRVALSDKLILPVYYQKGGRIYTLVPGHGRVEKRGKNAKINFLSAVALIRRSLELSESIARQNQSIGSAQRIVARDVEEQGKLLREAEAKSLELEAENARLRDELAAAKRQTPRVAEPQKKQFCSKVLILRPELVQAMKDRGATAAQARNTALIIQQLSYLIDQGFGKVLGDGRPYIFGTYAEFRERYFFFLSERTIERTFVGAESLGLVTSKQPEGRFSRRKYYMLTPEGAKMAASGKMAASSRQNGALQEGAKMAASSVQGEKNTSKNTSSSEKEAEGNSVSSPTGEPLEGRSIFSSLSSPKEERQEPAWFDEIRGMYPGTTVNDDLKRIEEWARKKRKEFTRDLALNALRRNPPKKPGQREGYVYHGKFIGKEKANALAAQNAELLLNAKRAIRHADGQIEMR